MKVLKVEGLSAMEAFNQNDQSNIVLRTKELSAKVPPAPLKKTGTAFRKMSGALRGAGDGAVAHAAAAADGIM